MSVYNKFPPLQQTHQLILVIPNDKREGIMQLLPDQ